MFYPHGEFSIANIFMYCLGNSDIFMKYSTPLSNEFITPREGSELTGYTTHYLTSLVRNNLIQGQRRSRSWLIDRDSLVSFASMHRKIIKKRSVSMRPRFASVPTTSQAIAVSGDRMRVDLEPVMSHALSLSIAFLVVASAAGVAQSPYFLRTLTTTGVQIQVTTAGVRASIESAPEQVAAALSPVSSRYVQVQGKALSTHALILVWAGYVSLGQHVYESVVQLRYTHEALVVAAGERALVFGEKSVEVLHTMPRVVERSSLALGAFVIGASHAVIDADVALAQYLAISTPIAARLTVETIGSFGDRIANETARIPSRYVFATKTIQYQYLALVQRAGEGAYASYVDLSHLLASLPPVSEIAGVVEYNVR